MGFPRRPRPRPTQGSSSESSSQQSHQTSSKRLKLETEPVFNGEYVRIFVVDAKLSQEQLRDITKKAEQYGATVVGRAQDATVVLTKTRLWSRIVKHLPGNDKDRKRIVSLEWLDDSIATGIQQPFNDNYLIKPPTTLDDLSLRGSPRPVSPGLSDTITVTAAAPSISLERPEVTDDQLPSPVYPTVNASTWITSRTKPPRWKNRRFACQRWHPLVCINQALLLELKHIREYNRLEGEERRSATYGKAMAAIKAYPYPLRSVKEAVSILGVGTKIAAQCGEYIKFGRIEAADIIKQDARYKTLIDFCKIHGVGPTTARDLYDKHECRSMADVEKVAYLLPSMGERSTVYVDEFDVKLARAEVEEIASIVDEHLQKLMPGALHTIVGGYRRGKAESNDVDIVFTHPEEAREKGSLQKVLSTLETSGYVTEVLYQAFTDSQRDPSMQHFHTSHMDPLDKAFTVWLSPANGTTRPQAIHRRVDLIAAPYKYYACAILGWSGSLTFERDLRHYAERHLGYKFDSGGLWRKADSQEILVKSEEEIFEILGLEYIPPEWRNADI